MSSREAILAKLRTTAQPFPGVQPPTDYQAMSPLETDADGLLARFVTEAEALSAVVHQPGDDEAAVQIILDVLDQDRSVLAWDWSFIALPGLQTALVKAHISVAAPEDPGARAGISGAEAALAATGSLVLFSGPGRFRATSLLPPVHIAVIRRSQILPNLEQWVVEQRADDLRSFRNTSNIVIISGPSRTSDIAMQPILGMHGPGELHILILNQD
jgi:L-lactate dehydrogenase complex protein LldG